MFLETESMTRASVIACLLAASLMGFSSTTRGEGWISSVRKKVREPAPKSSRDSQDSCESSPPAKPSSRGPAFWFPDSDEEDDDDSLSSFGFRIGAMAFSSPYWLPITLLQDDYSASAEFASFPYADDRDGRIVLIPDKATQSLAARLTTEVGSNLGDTVSWGGRLQLDTSFRLGIDMEFYSRIEDRPAGRDTIDTGDVNLVFRFAQRERAEFYSGVGMNYLLDNAGGDAFGFNFTYGADLFPLNPLVLSSSIDLGRLGGATLFHGRATIGADLNRVEVYTGYDVFSVGDAALHSWITGLRFYF